MSRPRNTTVPPSLGKRPVSMLKSVVLPAPLGPITLCKVPARTSRFTFAATISEAKRLLRSRTVSTGSVAAA